MMNNTRGGLSLGEDIITDMGEAEAARIRNEWDMGQEVDAYVTNVLGIPPPREPQYACPELKVEDLTTEDNQLYTRVFAQRTSWYGFLSEKKAQHDAKVIGLKAEMERIETNIRQTLRKNSTRKTAGGETKAPPGKEMEDQINEDMRYTECKRQLVFHLQILERLNARVQRLDRELRLTSRQVEIRRQELDSNGRSPNVRSGMGNRGGGGAYVPRTPRT